MLRCKPGLDIAVQAFTAPIPLLTLLRLQNRGKPSLGFPFDASRLSHGHLPTLAATCAEKCGLEWHFERFTEDIIEKLVKSKDETGERQPKKDERLYCDACKHPITRTHARTTVNGAHEHHFTNPHGISFRVGCFTEAPGCVNVGQGTEEHSWFPGYAWRVAVCESCQQHLGWGFHGRDAGHFFGLIVNRLSSAP